MRIPEFYPEKQGRPASIVAQDMESRAPSIPYGYVSGVLVTASYSGINQVSNYTAAGYTVILVDASSGGVVITLPAALTNDGRYYFIKKIDSSNNPVVIEGDVSAETIDGEASISLGLQYQYIMVRCDGTVWHILGGEYVKMEDLLDKLLNEQITLLLRILQEVGQSRLHLDNMSNIEVDEKDVAVSN